MTHPTILAPIDAPVNVIATLNGKPFLARYIPFTDHQPFPTALGEPAPLSSPGTGGAGSFSGGLS